MADENIVVRKWKFKDLKHYVQLLNNYYTMNKEDVQYSVPKEYFKRIIVGILGIVSKKYRNRRILYFSEYNGKIAGFVEYTNYKIGLHTGFFKGKYVHNDQIHLYRQFHRKGIVEALAYYSEKSFNGNKVIFGFINVNNLASLKAAERNNYKKYNKMLYMEASNSILENSGTLEKPATISRYKRKYAHELFGLYQKAIPDELKNEIFLEETFFEFSAIDFLADKFMDSLTHVYVRRYFVYLNNQIIGFFRIKKKKSYIELSLVAQPDSTKEFLQTVLTFLSTQFKNSVTQYFIFIEAYQKKLVEELLNAGFEQKKEYWEMVKIISKNEAQN